jgi:hypothetical protein
MRYYKTFDGIKVRTDAKANRAFVNINGKEKQLPPNTKLQADAIIENNQISKEQYGK